MDPTLHRFGKPENPPLLLLHGIGTGYRLWLRQIQHFQQSHFVVAPDIPGLTGTACPAGTTIHDLAARLESALRQQPFDKVAVCGLSAGASLAIALAARPDSCVNRLVLSAPQVLVPRLPMSLQIAVCTLIPERAMLATAGGMMRNDPAIAQAAAEDLKTLGKRGLLAAMKLLLTIDLRAELTRIAIPTTVLCGAADQVNLRAARFVAASLPGARLHIEREAGHLWNLQMPLRFNEVMAGALTSQTESNRDQQD